ncbi:dna-directed RNA polymerase [Cyanidiococcus yangmingshanensis]|uniref:DNA-directed RNA polymerase subunit n=1 Tax=Cyanidiococcus yangmingshanensis TaxID=2690220 RepID=A0A7J7IIJ2_9RHOD|nr:dna-directed RNA polymerase [Cyanidiococcus yangmingshanensis]
MILGGRCGGVSMILAWVFSINMVFAPPVHLGFFACPGHCGHIELAQPVVNPLLFSVLVRVLRGICFGCANFRLPIAREKLWIKYIKRIEAGLWQDAEAVADLLLLGRQNSSADRSCPACQTSDISSEDSEASIQNQKQKVSQNDYGKPRNVGSSRWQTITTSQRSSRRFQFVQRFIGECASSSSACTRCGTRAVRIRNDGFRIFARLPPSKKRSRTRGFSSSVDPTELDGESNLGSSVLDSLKLAPGREQLLLPSMVEYVLCELQRNSSQLCAFLFGHHIVEPFLLHVLLVPPSRFRLPSTTDDSDGGVPREHAQNFHYTCLLKANERVTQAVRAQDPLALGRAVIELQQSVQSLMDSQPDASMRRAPGIRQQLEHKEGIFRMHLMGKRVNYSARSVISPDPFLDVNEVGVPLHFAMKLSFPELVTDWNLVQLQGLVRNGPHRHPGANMLEKGKGLRIQIQARNAKQAQVLAETLFEQEETPDGSLLPARVFRHLRNGDRILFNRQPTLHRVGLLAHRVRVLGPTENTLRLHYANCGAYNADFDGDEMNLHVPQDWIAAAEAEYLLRTDHHYVSPTSGAPIRGLIQDHVLGAVLITQRDRFFSWHDFSNIIYAATVRLWESPRVGQLAQNERRFGPYATCAQVIPAILHPQCLWTGKQVITTVLRIIQYVADPERSCKSLSMASRAKVGSAYWGQNAAEEGTVIFRDGELLQGVLDKAQIGASPFGLVHYVHELLGPEASGNLLSCFSRLFTLFLRQHGHTTGIEDLLLQPTAEELRSKVVEQARSLVGPQVVTRVLQLPASTATELETALAEMLCSERGREVEARLDMETKKELAALGSRILESCIPHGLYKPFPRNGFALMTASGAKGSQVNAAQISCLLGSTILDGRRVPRTVVGWTLPSFRPYEAGTVPGGFISSRFLTGLSPQEYFFHCMAGREGLTDTAVKTARSGYLQRCLVKALENVAVTYDGTVRDSDGSIIQFLYGEDGLDPCHAPWLQKQLEWIRALCSKGPTDCSLDLDTIEAHRGTLDGGRITSFGTVRTKRSGRVATDDSVSASFRDSIQSFEAYERRALIDYYHRAAATPGDAVGVIAAQSIGEPSTQMTLNTFHFAGIGVEHVTVGVPRLRELLMFPGSAPATPFMQIPFRSNISKESAAQTCNSLRAIRLRDLVLKLYVCFDVEKGGAIARLTLRMNLAEPELYEKTLGVASISTQDGIAKTFGQTLKALISRRLRELENQQLPPMTSKLESAVSAIANVENEESAVPSTFCPEKLDTGFSDTSSESSLESDDVEALDLIPDSDPQADTFNVSDLDSTRETENEANRNMTELNVGSVDAAEHGSVAPGDVAADENSVDVGFLSESVMQTCLWIRSPLWYAIFIDELVLAAAERVFIRSVEGVRHSALVIGEDDELFLRTDGSNISLAWTLSSDKLDHERLHSNDISEVLAVYGVEAAQGLLVRELQTVFAAYGIPVDYRHLSLIADYQTALGGCRPFSRTGMRILDSVPSPLQRMSFESATQFLRDAALAREEDLLQSATARLCLGRVVSLGTGSFSLRVANTNNSNSAKST